MRKPSSPHWRHRETWIGCFDILGFKELVKASGKKLPCEILKGKLDELIACLRTDPFHCGDLHQIIFSDTFVVYASGQEPREYPGFLQVCQALIRRSVFCELPLRGAISVGTVIDSKEPPILLGPAFLDAYEYCIDQNWIGLILTPSAVAELRVNELDPLHHDFVDDRSIPLRKMKASGDVLAYRFQNGCASFESPFLPHLHQMKSNGARDDRKKYDNTIEFIQRHYRKLNRFSGPSCLPTAPERI